MLEGKIHTVPLAPIRLELGKAEPSNRARPRFTITSIEMARKYYLLTRMALS